MIRYSVRPRDKNLLQLNMKKKYFEKDISPEERQKIIDGLRWIWWYINITY